MEIELHQVMRMDLHDYLGYKYGRKDPEHPGSQSSVLSISWDPDGQYLITGSQDRVANIWDIERVVRILMSLRGHSGGIQSASWSPDQKWIITTSADNTAIIWDAESGEELLRLVGHTGSVNDAAWSPDGKPGADGQQRSHHQIMGCKSLARKWTN